MRQEVKDPMRKGVAGIFPVVPERDGQEGTKKKGDTSPLQLRQRVPSLISLFYRSSRLICLFYIPSVLTLTKMNRINRPFLRFRNLGSLWGDNLHFVGFGSGFLVSETFFFPPPLVILKIPFLIFKPVVIPVWLTPEIIVFWLS